MGRWNVSASEREGYWLPVVDVAVPVEAKTLTDGAAVNAGECQDDAC
jgi:hypothetical protein